MSVLSQPISTRGGGNRTSPNRWPGVVFSRCGIRAYHSGQGSREAALVCDPVTLQARVHRDGWNALRAQPRQVAQVVSSRAPHGEQEKGDQGPSAARTLGVTQRPKAVCDSGKKEVKN